MASWPMQGGAISSSIANRAEETARKPKALPRPSRACGDKAESKKASPTRGGFDSMGWLEGGQH